MYELCTSLLALSIYINILKIFIFASFDYKFSENPSN